MFVSNLADSAARARGPAPPVPAERHRRRRRPCRIAGDTAHDLEKRQSRFWRIRAFGRKGRKCLLPPSNRAARTTAAATLRRSCPGSSALQHHQLSAMEMLSYDPSNQAHAVHDCFDPRDRCLHFFAAGWRDSIDCAKSLVARRGRTATLYHCPSFDRYDRRA